MCAMLACYQDDKLISHISPLERAFLYGDGLFTTLKVVAGEPELWSYHLARLQHGASQLRLKVDWSWLHHHLQSLYSQYPIAIIKIIFSRGHARARGYAPPDQAAVVYTQVFALADNKAQTHAANALPISAGVLDQTIGQVMPRLAGIKTLNRLEQVLLQQELSLTMWQEALVCDAQGFVVEGVSSNCFMRINGIWHTPEIACAGIAGVMRAYILDLCCAQNINITVKPIALSELQQIDALFFCNALHKIRTVSQFYLAANCAALELNTQIVMEIQQQLGLS